MTEIAGFSTRWGIVFSIVAAVAFAGCAADEAEQEAELTPEERHAKIMDHAREVSKDIDTVEEAEAAGYEPDQFCIPGMGVHWLHKPGQEDSHIDTELDKDHPEVVIFLPEDDNFTDPETNEFLAIEYLVVTEGTDRNSTETKPDLMGEPFDGPMPGHGPEMPWHVDFHIYLAEGYESGPDFPAQQPEKIECPEGTTPPQEE